MKFLFLFLLLISQASAANLYVRSTNATADADNGTTWALAKTSLSGAFAVAAAGDTIYVSQAHAGTVATTNTLTSPGTAASPCLIICANDAAEPPTATATTATISTTGTNSEIRFNGFAYYYGITFTAGSAGNPKLAFNSTNLPFNLVFDSCKMVLNGGTGSGINMGSVSSSSDDGGVTFTNTTAQFNNAAQSFSVRCPFLWKNTASAIAGSTFPAALFILPSAGNSALATVRGVDLSALTSNALVDVSLGNWGQYRFENCKLGTGFALTTGAFAGQGGAEVTVVNCDSGNTNYKYNRSNYMGTVSQETTIVRTSGATDGTTAASRKMVTSANSKFTMPLESQPIYFWNETLTAQDIAINVVTDNVTLTDAEAWIEVEYLGTSGFPLGNLATDRAASVLATPAAQTTDAVSSWTTTGLTTPVKQTLSVNITPAIKGLIRARVVMAKPSTTLYFDPLISAGSRQYQGGDGFINGPTVSGGGGSTEHSSTFVQ